MTDEIELLRAFGASDPEPPAELQARLEERLLQQVLAAEEQLAGRRRRRPWYDLLVRQAPVAAMAAVLVVALSFESGHTGGTAAKALPSSNTAGVLSQAADTMQSQQATPGGRPVSLAQSAYVQQPDAGTTPAQPAESAPDAGATAPVPSSRTTEVATPSTTVTIPDELLISAGPQALDDQQLAAIPTDERLLLTMLRSATSGDGSHDADFEPFRIASEYVSDDRVPGPQRAAFLRAVGLMDGVEAGDESTDAIGRTGVVISRLDGHTGVRQQYLLDANAGTILEHREFTTRGDLGQCPPGTIVALDVYDGGKLLTQDDAAASGGRPWPDVRPDCA